MKFITVASLLTISAHAAVVQRRQHDGMGGMMSSGSNSGSKPKGGLSSLTGKLGMKIQKAMKIESIPSKIHKGATRVRLTYGPYKIRSSTDKKSLGNSISMDPHGSSYAFMVGDDFPRDVMVLEASSVVVNETFQEAIIGDGLYNHHNLFADLSKFPETWLSCGDKPRGAIPVTVLTGGATGAGPIRYTSADGEHKSGFYVSKNEIISVGIDVVNYTPRERTVYTVSELEYLPGKPAGYMHTQSHVLPLGMCDSGGGMSATHIRPPPGQSKFTLAGKNEITVIKDGYLVQTYGHLHDGGDKFVILLNGKPVCESTAIYGGPAHEQVQENGEVWKTIASMSECGEAIRVRKGDKLQFTASFDLTKHKSRQSAHGEEAESMALAVTSWAPLGPGET